MNKPLKHFALGMAAVFLAVLLNDLSSSPLAKALPGVHVFFIVLCCLVGVGQSIAALGAVMMGDYDD